MKTLKFHINNEYVYLYYIDSLMNATKKIKKAAEAAFYSSLHITKLLTFQNPYGKQGKYLL